MRQGAKNPIPACGFITEKFELYKLNATKLTIVIFKIFPAFPLLHQISTSILTANGKQPMITKQKEEENQIILPMG